MYRIYILQLKSKIESVNWHIKYRPGGDSLREYNKKIME